MAHVTYQWLEVISDSIGLLSDGGANSGLAGTDVGILEYTE